MKKTKAMLLPAAKLGHPGPKDIAVAWVKQAVRRIENPTGDRGEDLHLVRGTINRLRAIMRMIRPVIGETLFCQENHRLRSAAHALSGPRDNTVGRQTLEDLAESVKKKKERKAFKRMLELYEAANRRQERERERLEEAMRAAARALRFSGARIQRLPIDPEAWRTIGPGFQRVYRSGRRRMKKAIADEGDAAFHRWRIRTRNLSDQLEYLAPFWPKRLGRVKSQLGKLKGKLGCDHDLTILKAALNRITLKLDDADAAECVLERLRKRSRKLRSASGKLGEAIFHEAPGCFVHRLKKHWRKRREATAKIGEERKARK